MNHVKRYTNANIILPPKYSKHWISSQNKYLILLRWIGWLAGRQVCRSVGWLVGGRLVDWSVHQSVGPSVRPSVGRSVSPSVGQSVGA